MERIAILASGSGTNAQRLIEHFAQHLQAQVVLVCCDQPKAGVIQRAWDLGVPCYLFGSAELKNGSLLKELRGQGITLMVLAGFMRLIPTDMIAAYRDRIVNIHPSLLPKFGGKGMYGDHVHAAVIAAGETESGITIHLVNEQYDEGRKLFQAKCEVLPGDTTTSLTERIHRLEHEHYARVVETMITG